jgi:AcrR family transcriptional regulator
MQTAQPKHCKAGRPRRGTESERLDALIQAATTIFLKEGYGLASIDKIAGEAGISTRTIYERFKNKADLMAAVVERLMDRDMARMFESQDIDHLQPVAALTLIGETVVNRFRDPDSAALFRIIATEAHRFPELTDKVRCTNRQRFEAKLSTYFRRQTERGIFALEDPDRAAHLFLNLIAADIQDCLLFEPAGSIGRVDWPRHVNSAVQLFLFGASPRSIGEGVQPCN